MGYFVLTLCSWGIMGLFHGSLKGAFTFYVVCTDKVFKTAPSHCWRHLVHRALHPSHSLPTNGVASCHRLTFRTNGDRPAAAIHALNALQLLLPGLPGTALRCASRAAQLSWQLQRTQVEYRTVLYCRRTATRSTKTPVLCFARKRGLRTIESLSHIRLGGCWPDAN